MPDVFAVFDEWRAAWDAGARPDEEGFLARAGEAADEFALLVELHLVRAEPPAATEEAVVAVAALATGEPPLVELRRRRGLRREDVVEQLIALFGLDARKRGKVLRYYGEVEVGERVPANVRLVRGLGEVLSARVEELLAWRPAPPPQPVLYRAMEAAPAAPAMAAAKREWDEIDELFQAQR